MNAQNLILLAFMVPDCLLSVPLVFPCTPVSSDTGPITEIKMYQRQVLDQPFDTDGMYAGTDLSFKSCPVLLNTLAIIL